MRRVTDEGVGADQLTEVVDHAVQVIMRTNRCDQAAARAILTSTAVRNRLEETEVAVTLVALSSTPRRARPPIR